MSTAGHRTPLAAARKIADGLVEIFAPACDRFEVAGSVRRERATVGDLEFVCIPKAGEALAPQGTLFGSPNAARSNLLWEAIETYSDGHLRLMPIKPGTEAIEPDLRWLSKRPLGESKLFKLWLPRQQVAVELYLVTPETWGCAFAIRTGSATFSKALVQRWTQVSGGGHCRDLRLCWRDGVAIPTPEEEDVFRNCQLLPVTPPPERDALLASQVPRVEWKAVTE